MLYKKALLLAIISNYAYAVEIVNKTTTDITISNIVYPNGTRTKKKITLKENTNQTFREQVKSVQVSYYIGENYYSQNLDNLLNESAIELFLINDQLVLRPQPPKYSQLADSGRFANHDTISTYFGQPNPEDHTFNQNRELLSEDDIFAQPKNKNNKNNKKICCVVS